MLEGLLLAVSGGALGVLIAWWGAGTLARMIGPSAAMVDSSWIDMLAGLVIIGIRRTPPDF